LTDFEDPYAGVFDFKTVDAPYLEALPPKEQAKTYTLVMDLDETLVHYEEVIEL